MITENYGNTLKLKDIAKPCNTLKYISNTSEHFEKSRDVKYHETGRQSTCCCTGKDITDHKDDHPMSQELEWLS